MPATKRTGSAERALVPARLRITHRLKSGLLVSSPNLFPPWSKQFNLKGDLHGAIFTYNSSMRLPHVMSATRIVSSKSGVRHLHDSCTQHEKCRRIFKHVLKSHDSRSHNQNVRMTSCTRSLHDASGACYKSRIRQS